MEHADGEIADAELAARLERDPEARAKLASIKQVGELVRGHLELSADAVPDAKFAAMWRRVDQQLAAATTGLWSRVSAWFDRYRGHVITGAVSAGAVAALALILRPSAPDGDGAGGAPGPGGAAIAGLMCCAAQAEERFSQLRLDQLTPDGRTHEQLWRIIVLEAWLREMPGTSTKSKIPRLAATDLR
jgi:hypothetical protein